uniref:Methyltransferase domain-containing protein n=1 Tax=Candidatus Kentrum sp. FW TaxID=2126338 RepID=A0A450RWI9_9GAMM|nr:MAG: Methyltransferase domain-containing protein [Candidatus Kentron sp. FW]
MTTTTPNLYQEIWERYWSTLPSEPQTALWDSTPQYAAALDVPRFKAAFGQERPILDFGCGNGTQTRYLAEHFARVIGTDISSVAIESARRADNPSNVEYRVIDGINRTQVETLSAELGDVNIYMRTVLHQMQPEHRGQLAAATEKLLGRTGMLYLVELSEEADAYFQRITEEAGAPPEKLAVILQSGITPGLLKISDIQEFFPNRDIRSGPTVINTMHILPSGDRAQVPAFYALIGPGIV